MQTFADKYEALYGKGSAFKEAGVEIGVLRVTAVGTIPRPRLAYQITENYRRGRWLTRGVLAGNATFRRHADLHWCDTRRAV